MARVEKFEDLFAWQQSRKLTGEVYRITNQGRFQKDFRLRDQIQAASTSVMANIAEGFDRGRRQEFAQFLSIAKGSCAEVRSHLYVALDAGYIDQAEFDVLSTRPRDVAGLISKLRASLEGWQKTE